MSVYPFVRVDKIYRQCINNNINCSLKISPCEHGLIALINRQFIHKFCTVVRKEKVRK